MTERKKIFIISPYQGKRENIEKAKAYIRYVIMEGYIPVCPHVTFHGALDDHNQLERQLGIGLGWEVMRECYQAWRFGDEDTEGVQGDIRMAGMLDIPVVHIAETDVL